MESPDKNFQGSIESANLEDNSKTILLDINSASGVVPNPRGTIWSTMGRVADSKMTVNFEEMLYLAEFLNYDIIFESQIISFKQVLSYFPAYNLNDYEMYKDLRRHGYVLMPRDSPYWPVEKTFPDSRPEWSLFKPNSSFKKTEPAGRIGQLVGLKKSDSILNVAELMSKNENADKRFMLCLPDGSNQFLYFEAELCQPKPEPSSPSRSKCKMNNRK